MVHTCKLLFVHALLARAKNKRHCARLGKWRRNNAELTLQHVLPRGFRWVRDYGFLHGNAKQTLALVQWVLRVVIAPRVLRPRPVFRCPKCQSPMCIVALVRPAWQFG